MRDRTAIEREIFHAREDLESNLDRLMHRVRERLAVRARAGHAIRGFTREFPAVTTVCVIACVLAVWLVARARRRGA
jgi:hypothetical protein